MDPSIPTEMKPLEAWTKAEVQRWFLEAENGRFSKWAAHFSFVDGKELASLSEHHVVQCTVDPVVGATLWKTLSTLKAHSSHERDEHFRNFFSSFAPRFAAGVLLSAMVYYLASRRQEELNRNELLRQRAQALLTGFYDWRPYGSLLSQMELLDLFLEHISGNPLKHEKYNSDQWRALALEVSKEYATILIQRKQKGRQSLRQDICRFLESCCQVTEGLEIEAVSSVSGAPKDNSENESTKEDPESRDSDRNSESCATVKDCSGVPERTEHNRILQVLNELETARYAMVSAYRRVYTLLHGSGNEYAIQAMQSSTGPPAVSVDREVLNALVEHNATRVLLYAAFPMTVAALMTSPSMPAGAFKETSMEVFRFFAEVIRQRALHDAKQRQNRPSNDRDNHSEAPPSQTDEHIYIPTDADIFFVYNTMRDWSREYREQSD